jgi:hypothetical protein
MPTRRHSRIPEHRQLTRLQVYDVASALWPWLPHLFLKRRRLGSSSLEASKHHETDKPDAQYNEPTQHRPLPM